MANACIVTGGAGFIGCALSEGLVNRYDRVIVIDSLNPQIHQDSKRPAMLAENVELIKADICDEQCWDQVLPEVETPFDVIHLAAETGTGQSLNYATLHTYTNVVGTTRMLDAFVRHNKLPEQILLTSSRAVYGEGQWKRTDGMYFYPGQRSDAQLCQAQWDFSDAQYVYAQAGKTIPNPTSIYGVTKQCQENLLSAWCQAMNVTYKIVRLQNVYGPGQSLINSYTGIVSLFVRMAKKGETIPLYEDGQIIRDFVLIDDVAHAILMVMDSATCAGQVLDIGTGKATTIAEIADWIAGHYHAPKPVVCGKYRNGDVRSACCDMDRTKRLLGFEAEFTVEQGLEKLCGWIDQQLQS